MKKKDLTDLQGKTTSELNVLANKTRLAVAKAKMELKMHKTKNTNTVSNLRKSLAQILTVKSSLERKG